MIKITVKPVHTGDAYRFRFHLEIDFDLNDDGVIVESEKADAHTTHYLYVYGAKDKEEATKAFYAYFPIGFPADKIVIEEIKWINKVPPATENPNRKK